MKKYPTENGSGKFSLETTINNRLLNFVKCHTSKLNPNCFGTTTNQSGVILLPLIFVTLLFATSCKEQQPEPQPKEPWVQEIYPLAGTKWEVSKVIHTETGVERPIFVGDGVFTPFVPILDFETDTTGSFILRGNDYGGIPFNFNDDPWYKGYIFGYDSNIEMLFMAFARKEVWAEDYNRWYGHIGYKLEGTQLKLYFHDDGFFYFNKDGIIGPMYGECTDSNWYNCVVFEEVE